MSPTLFALYILFIYIHYIYVICHGLLRDVTIQEDMVISDLELADNLALLANSAEDIRVFLSRLHARILVSD